MTSVSVARFAQIEPVLWKNGLGKTTQLAVHPQGSGSDDFEWRVSIARLDASAPFSRFDGVDRCLAVLQGEMSLRGLPGVESMTPRSTPLHFSGTEAVEGQVIRGPVLDLNVMYKAKGWYATMRRVRWPSVTAVTLSDSQLLCSLSDRIDITVTGEKMQLALFDLLSARAPVEVQVGGSGAVEVYVIEIHRRQASG